MVKCAKAVCAVNAWLRRWRGSLWRDEFEDEVDTTHRLFDLIRIALLPPVFWMIIGRNKEILGGKLVASAAMRRNIHGLPVTEFVEEFGGHFVAIHLVDQENIFRRVIVAPEARVFRRYLVERSKHSPKFRGCACLPGSRWTYKEDNKRFLRAGSGGNTLVCLEPLGVFDPGRKGLIIHRNPLQ